MRDAFDAIVIGGGPAGALAGLFLARQGWRIAIIERGPRYRNKTCGHCLNPRALPILRDVGLLDAVRRVSVCETRVLRVHAERATFELKIDAEQEGLLVDRTTFDQLLLDRAGAHGAKVMQPVARASSPGAPLFTRAGSPCHRFVIGADGLGSGVARAFGAAPAHVGRKFGFAFDLAATMNEPHVINMFVTEGGYLGVAQRRDGSIHCAGLIGTHDRMPRDPIAFCHALAMQFEELRTIGFARIGRTDVRNFIAAGPMPWRPRKIAGEHFALLGDAAGYVEPFTGEGMGWAMQCAQTLAETVSSVRPGQWNEQLASQYTSLWRQRIGRAQRRCAAIGWALERPWALTAARHFIGRALLQRLARQVVAA